MMTWRNSAREVGPSGPTTGLHRRDPIRPPAPRIQLVDLPRLARPVGVRDQPRAVRHVDVVEERDLIPVRRPDRTAPVADAALAGEDPGGVRAVGSDHPDLEREVGAGGAFLL